MNELADVRPDFTAGVDLAQIADGSLLAGRVGDEDALLLRTGDALHAFSAHCSHYGGDLAGGLIVGNTIRCPLHHASFDVRTGEAVRAPALDPIPCWRVERSGGMAYVRERVVSLPHSHQSSGCVTRPKSVVIVGGGAAGLAAAEMLRRTGYQGPVTMVSAEDSPPCDRPNLSKDYLAGTASDDWIPLRPPEFYLEHSIELIIGTRATALDTARRRVRLEDDRELSYDVLLLATGAEPVRLQIPGAPDHLVHYLRSYAEARSISTRAQGAKRVVIVGASFIGLEVAASLRARDIEVHVVGLEEVPMERVLGASFGQWVRALHESHGVVFHLQTSLKHVDESTAHLANGESIEDVDLIVVGAGVRPALALAEQAGLALDWGVVVDEFMQTSAPGVYAAGDIARWPDLHSGQQVRVEHWATALAQGQIAAMNMLGARRRFETVPYFWSQHYDVAIQYVGHAEAWDAIDVNGSLDGRDATVRYTREGRTLAIATVGRDRGSLHCEAAMECAGQVHESTTGRTA